jgi:type IV secretory pathway TraG/TraD family ATPase VirD4
MQAIKKRARITPPRHHRCMFLIDEFGSIGNMAGLPQDIAIMAGYGLDFTLIVQGLDQLEHHYGAAKNTILSNCAWKWFCNIADLETAKYLSQTLGKKTVATVSTSQSTGTSGEHPTAGTSTSTGETGRDLLTPDEILNLGRDVAILLNPSTAPHYLRPVDYWELTQKFAYLQKTHPSLYWKPPLSYDDNPYIKSPQLSANPTIKQLEAFFGKKPPGLPSKFPDPSKPFDPKNPFGT